MKIKSLLIGSAAVMAAASGARAADAVVMAPAPEPMEYVRVCDVYGAGFFYIPGTETCLRISGFVFYDTGFATDTQASDTPNYDGFTPGQFNSHLRTRIRFDARSETELGTLRSFIQVQSDYTNGAPSEFGDRGNDPNLGLDEAWLSLGGLRVGYAPSAFTYTVNGGASGFGSHTWNGMVYGYNQRDFVQYNWSGANGLFATVSLEQDYTGDAAFTGVTADYMPDVVGKIGVTQGWGTLWAQVGVDTESENLDGFNNRSSAGPDGTGDVEYALEGGISLNIPGLEGDSLRVLGWYSSGPNSYFNNEWAVIGSYYHTFTPTFGASIGGEYISQVEFTDADQWLAEIGLVWTPVTNFEVRSEITYTKVQNDPFYGDRDGTVSGFLRFQRSF